MILEEEETNEKKSEQDLSEDGLEDYTPQVGVLLNCRLSRV